MVLLFCVKFILDGFLLKMKEILILFWVGLSPQSPAVTPPMWVSYSKVSVHCTYEHVLCILTSTSLGK